MRKIYEHNRRAWWMHYSMAIALLAVGLIGLIYSPSYFFIAAFMVLGGFIYLILTFLINLSGKTTYNPKMDKAQINQDIQHLPAQNTKVSGWSILGWILVGMILGYFIFGTQIEDEVYDLEQEIRELEFEIEDLKDEIFDLRYNRLILPIIQRQNLYWG